MLDKRPLIIDCDPGNGVPGANVDDSIALSFAAKSADIDLIAVWTVFGNTTSAQGFASATALLDALGEGGIPVRRGSDAPLSGERTQWIENRKRAAASTVAPQAWKAVPREESFMSEGVPDTGTPCQLAADVFSLDGPVDIAAIGPLTNIARLITEVPDVIARIRRIYIMGGSMGFGDEVDTNFAVDPQAARIVLRSGIPLTIVPLDVTRTTHLSADVWARIYASADMVRAPWKDYINGWLTPWLDFSERTRPVDGMWIHDLVAVAAFSHPDLVDCCRAHVLLAPNGKLHRDIDSQVAATPSSKAVPCGWTGAEIELCTRVNNDELLRVWAETVMAARIND